MLRITGAALFASILFGLLSALPADDKKNSNKIYELRVYTTNEGKLDDLHSRFRDHTNKLFKKHGMELVAYWTPSDPGKKFPFKPENTLIYVLAYPSKQAREKSWKGFIGDPEWKKVFAASREDGPIVSKVQSCFMNPTDYSPMK